jgi:hypothetical protein
LQRRYNYALQPMSKAAFIELVTADQPEAPAYFGYDAMLNRRERPTLEEALERGLTALALDEVLRLQNAGAQVLDVAGYARCLRWPSCAGSGCNTIGGMAPTALARGGQYPSGGAIHQLPL